MSQYGFVKIERDVAKAVPTPKAPVPHLNTDLPSSEFSQAVLKVYLYSRAIIKDQFPDWKLDDEVVFVTSLLHDIGTTEENMHGTKMSFEFYGGLLSRDLVLEKTKNQDYAEAVSEAIIRHQDLGESGYITTLGLILQIATTLDNIGANTNLIHLDTLDAVNKKYGREGWASCFGAAIDNENKLKPWGHTSALGVDEFRDNVLGNKVKSSQIVHLAILKAADLAEDIQLKIFDLANAAIQNYKIEKDIAAFLKKELDQVYGPTWHVIVGKSFGSYVTHEQGYFIYFYIGELAFLVFKSG
ncbi:hypothetical protein KGF57_001991 [Candida theae]|uniref:Dynein light chain 1, cytoplasmic n=1 Tax=Candida theae TaxID=1198502 RepID=A0AAD5FZ56_9ASCO|nr:uncharacterized protein KGF57_001991 [Candida theae]KAI5959991.1 hypothetical protein KGF57_001991 [Candida theae]